MAFIHMLKTLILVESVLLPIQKLLILKIIFQLTRRLDKSHFHLETVMMFWIANVNTVTGKKVIIISLLKLVMKKGNVHLFVNILIKYLCTLALKQIMNYWQSLFSIPPENRYCWCWRFCSNRKPTKRWIQCLYQTQKWNCLEGCKSIIFRKLNEFWINLIFSLKFPIAMTVGWTTVKVPQLKSKSKVNTDEHSTWFDKIISCTNSDWETLTKNSKQKLMKFKLEQLPMEDLKLHLLD